MEANCNSNLVKELEMALQKDTTTDSAVSANYYKIDEIRGDTKSGSTRLKVGLYKSKADRGSGSVPVKILRMSVTVDYSSDSSILSQAYSALKLEDYFSGAIDA